MIFAVAVSLLAGLTIVASRTANARLAGEKGMLQSTLFNYITGLAGSVVLMLALGRNFTVLPGQDAPPLWAYLGGLLGVCVVTLLNITVSRVASLYVTLLCFVGEVFAGIVLDSFLKGAFSPGTFLGGLLVAAGLVVNLLVDRSEMKKSKEKAAEVAAADEAKR